LETALAEARNSIDQLLVEEFVPGRELTIGILGDQALPILESSKGGFYESLTSIHFSTRKPAARGNIVCPAKI